MKITGKIMLYKYRWMSLVGIVSIMVILISYRVYRPSEVLISKDISSPVEIYRDAYGVPHVYADNMKDLFFGWGYAAAQDRMWQMELYRRKIQGKRSEIYGNKLKNDDIFRKTLGLKRYAEQDLKLLEPEIKELLESYASGVNMLLLDRTKRPKEFDKLRYEPDPWTILDILCMEKYLAWNFNDGGGTELSDLIVQYKDMQDQWNSEKMKEILMYNYHFFSGAGSRHSMSSQMGIMEMINEQIDGSNCWAVDGTKSKTGKPMLANDPHTPLLIPQYWHEVHLAIPEKNFHCAGISLPGGCIIYIGRTNHVAWGLTKSYIDCVDIVEEKINPRNSNEYLDGKRWKSFVIQKQKISIKENEDIEVTIKENDRGLYLFKDTSTGTIKLFQWTGLGPSCGTNSFINAYAVETIHEFIKCLKPMRTPILNMHFADSSGNIGYYVIGKIPRHSFNDGTTVIQGWEGKKAWSEFVPFNKNPHNINPSEHFIATANNRMVGTDYPYYLYNSCAPNYRYDRIAEVIDKKHKIDVRDMMSLQLDIYEIKAQEIVPVVVDICEDNITQDCYKKALKLFKIWDYRYKKDSAAPVIFESFYKLFINNIFKDVMDKKIQKAVFRDHYRAESIIRRIFKKGYSAWLDSNIEIAREKFKHIVIGSFTEGVDALMDAYEDDITHLQWGMFHKQVLLDNNGSISDIISPFSRDGGPETLNRGGGLKIKGKPSKSGASYRIVVDFADEDVLYYSCLIPGQSENPKSRHFIDQVELWKKGEYKKIYREKKDILKHQYEYIRIIPEKKIHVQ